MVVLNEVGVLDGIRGEVASFKPMAEVGETLAHRDAVIRTQTALSCQIEEKLFDDAGELVEGEGHGRSGEHESFTIDEVNGAEQAQKCPHIIPFPLLAHIKQHEGNEHTQGDDLLHDLELCEGETCGASQVVSRDHEAVLKESESPADEYEFPEAPIRAFTRLT